MVCEKIESEAIARVSVDVQSSVIEWWVVATPKAIHSVSTLVGSRGDIYRSHRLDRLKRTYGI